MIEDFPKLKAPFEREGAGNNYFCVPKINDDYRWVFDPKTDAVDKLDGTNVSVYVENGNIISVYNRTTQVGLFTNNSLRFYNGVVNAIDRGHFIPGPTGQFFGELIGPKIQGNPYKLEEYRWEPFEYLRRKFRLKFWNAFVAELEGKTDEEIYNATSELFKSLWSIYKLNCRFDKEPVDENTGFAGVAAEGLVFYSPDGKMAKLRRDMFDWFKGKGHKR